jgi:4-amino-4-deoxy-L-arabinose transferase-like glycosyltransferase
MRKTLVIILWLALFLRVGFIVFYENGKMLQNRNYSGDEFSYDSIARNFLAGKGLVTDDHLYARRAPLYPLFLAATYATIGHSQVAVRFLQVIIGVASCYIIFLIGMECFGERIGVISAFISSFYYPFIQLPSFLLTELFFSFLLSLAVYFFIRYYKHRKSLFLCSGTTFFALACLTKGQILFFIVPVFFWVFTLSRYNLRLAVKPIVIMLLSITIVIGPWIIRNYKIYNAFVPVSLETGVALYLGNNPMATGGTGGWSNYGQDQFFPENLKEIYTLSSDRKLTRLAIDYIIHNPLNFLKLSVRKFFNMWRPFYADARLMNKVIMILLYVPIVLLAILGMVQAFRFEDRSLLLPVYGLLFYSIVIHMASIGIIRYRDPLMPYIIIFAAYRLRSAWG